MLPENISCNPLPVATLAERRELPECPAIYFVLEKDQVVYIGQTVNLRQRINGHHRLPEWKVRDDIHIRWLPCSNAATLPQLEKHLIEMVQPEMNNSPVRNVENLEDGLSSDRKRPNRLSIGLSEREYKFLEMLAVENEETLAAQLRMVLRSLPRWKSFEYSGPDEDEE